MNCPECGHDDTDVKDSRPIESGKVIRRRRKCAGCGVRFTTYEMQGDNLGHVIHLARAIPQIRKLLEATVKDTMHIEYQLLPIVEQLDVSPRAGKAPPWAPKEAA